VIPRPTAETWVTTYDHPIQSLVWDDFTAEPGTDYVYEFHPLRGTPGAIDRSAPPVTVEVTTEELYGGTHDVFFNRGVVSSQGYARKFHNLHPGKQPSVEKRFEAYAWLARDLETALMKFIGSAKKGDQLHGCFYEFQYPPVLEELKAAVGRGVVLRLVVDEKPNESCDKVTDRDGTVRHELSMSNPRTPNLQAMCASQFPHKVVARESRRDVICHNKFLVLTPKGAAGPTEVWTGSTNLTEGGVFGQANVGHWVRDAGVARAFLDYWELLAQDPGARTAAAGDPLNVAYLTAVTALTPTPASVDAIAQGVTPVFSPRTSGDALDLYVELLGGAEDLGCATFAFGISPIFKRRLQQNSSKTGPLTFLLLEKEDRPDPRSKDPFIALRATNNVYEAFGSEIDTPLGQWVAETDTKRFKLNYWVAFVHLKVLLRDPLGSNPIVVTGSANFSTASTVDNDENMMIIRGDRRVADIYFTEFNRLWGHYYFRSVVEQMSRRKPRGTVESGPQFLAEDGSWLANYAAGKLRSKRAALFSKMALT
jgi:phosphatidylserine/phosphatidylglycerophosphate/cardiolipin synthase-like enzyme